MVLPAIQKFPITIGFLLISMAHASCGGLALICAVFMYSILLSKMYEDYLEEFVFKTASVIAEKLFGKKPDVKNAQNDSNRITSAITLLENTRQKRQNSNVTAINTEEKKDNKLNEADESDTFKVEERPKEENDSKEIKGKKGKKESKDKKDGKNKKVEFVMNEENQNDQSESLNETAKSSVEEESKSKLDLEVKEDAVVPSGSQESFEVLFNQLNPDDVALFSRQDEPEELTEEEKLEMEKAEAELEKLITQMTERQKIEDEKRLQEVKVARAEYDEVPDGLSAIHFHMTIFLLLCVLALLNLPSVIVLARNYKYGEKILQHDPSYFSSIASIISLSVIWQLPTPRNVHGYEPLSSLCYVMAMIAVLYCQDSLYRLNAIISSMFLMIALQQLFMPKLLIKNEPKEENIIDSDLLERVRRLREDMTNTTELKAPPLN